MGDTHLNLPPIDLMPDGNNLLSRYVAIAENRERAFACIFILHGEDEQHCRSLIARWFLSTDHGVPTSCTLVPISGTVTSFNISSNDDDVCDFLHLD